MPIQSSNPLDSLAGPSQPASLPSAPEISTGGNPLNSYVPSQPQANVTDSSPSLGQSLMNNVVAPVVQANKTVGDFGTGVLKGLDQFLVNSGYAASEIGSLPGKVISRALGQSEQPDQVRASINKGLEANEGEGGGKLVGETIPSLLVPETRTGKALSDALYSAATGAFAGAGNSGTALGTALGGFSGAALNAVTAPLVNTMQRVARSWYRFALAPTRIGAKQVTNNVLLNNQGNDLVDRGVTAWSMRGLHQKLSDMANDYGQRIDNVMGQLHSMGAVANLTDVLKAGQDYIDDAGRFRDPTSGMISDLTEKQYHAANNVQRDILDAIDKSGAAGDMDKVPFPTARFIRQQLDNAVYKDELRPDVSTTAQEFSNYMANRLRGAIASQDPTQQLANLNAEYHFLRTGANVVGLTMMRKTGQAGFGAEMDAAIGANFAHIVAANPIMMSAIVASRRSTAVSTGGSVFLDRVAKAIQSNKNKGATALSGAIAQAWNNSK